MNRKWLSTENAVGCNGPSPLMDPVVSVSWVQKARLRSPPCDLASYLEATPLMCVNEYIRPEIQSRVKRSELHEYNQ
jgi:hypothetical protein